LRAANRMHLAIRALVASLTKEGGAFKPDAWLERLCQETARLFASRRVSVWLYDRAAREMVLAASSRRDGSSRSTRTSLPDPVLPAAADLCQPRAAVLAGSVSNPVFPGLLVTVPLKAQRRALGTMVIEEVRWKPGRQSNLLNHLDALGQQVAILIDSAHLFNDVMKTRERLARAEALGQLVAGIAHELNNPLQTVLGHLELLRATRRIADNVAADYRIIYREADRAARIVRNLLLLGGSGRLVLRRISLNAAITRALQLRTPALRAAHIVVRRTLLASMPRVLGDGLLLQQAFLNLLMNAEQAMVGGPGRINLVSAVSADGARVTVTIRDSGPGIPDDVLPRVFDPFFTTKPAGSGLGLATTHRIVREHGGEIFAANHPEGGAVFTVRLPVATMVK
jgi:signal transduction histidine kinase